MRAFLEIVTGPAAGQKTRLIGNQILHVGRTEKAGIALPGDREMSRRHFSIEFDGSTVTLCDLGSSNGTALNGAPITESQLRDGDRFTAGITDFVVHLEDDARTAAAATNVTAEPRSSGSEPGGLSASAFADEDLTVRREALFAAAWSRQRSLLDFCRTAARTPAVEDIDALLLLGILGTPADLDAVLAIGRTAELGQKRFEILAAFGHPVVMDLLLAGIESEDPLEAVAAAAAFTRMTGKEIESDDRATLPPEDDSERDEFEEEFADEVTLPDAKAAREHWDKVKDQFTTGDRWSQGCEIAGRHPAEFLADLDMRSRWEASLRGHFNGTWSEGLIDLEAMMPSESGGQTIVIGH